MIQSWSGGSRNWRAARCRWPCRRGRPAADVGSLCTETAEYRKQSRTLRGTHPQTDGQVRHISYLLSTYQRLHTLCSMYTLPITVIFNIGRHLFLLAYCQENSKSNYNIRLFSNHFTNIKRLADVCYNHSNKSDNNTKEMRIHEHTFRANPNLKLPTQHAIVGECYCKY